MQLKLTTRVSRAAESGFGAPRKKIEPPPPARAGLLKIFTLNRKYLFSVPE